jgi:hypothetical protein
MILQKIKLFLTIGNTKMAAITWHIQWKTLWGNVLILFLSENTKLLNSKLCWNVSWVVLYKMCDLCVDCKYNELFFIWKKDRISKFTYLKGIHIDYNWITFFNSFLRTSNGSAIAYFLNYHCEMKSQACPNLVPMVFDWLCVKCFRNY